jgi:hypothetical protein
MTAMWCARLGLRGRSDVEKVPEAASGPYVEVKRVSEREMWTIRCVVQILRLHTCSLPGEGTRSEFDETRGGTKEGTNLPRGYPEGEGPEGRS